MTDAALCKGACGANRDGAMLGCSAIREHGAAWRKGEERCEHHHRWAGCPAADPRGTSATDRGPWSQDTLPAHGPLCPCLCRGQTLVCQAPLYGLGALWGPLPLSHKTATRHRGSRQGEAPAHLWDQEPRVRTPTSQERFRRSWLRRLCGRARASVCRDGRLYATRSPTYAGPRALRSLLSRSHGPARW